ncbi:hypothetical protein EDB84DRAFT_1438264 [Lactarius hengduanensis]|nr:hypothetical protein EDB84DRAFT_1438264 [Lactarius hengduanensis]
MGKDKDPSPAHPPAGTNVAVKEVPETYGGHTRAPTRHPNKNGGITDMELTFVYTPWGRSGGDVNSARTALAQSEEALEERCMSSAAICGCGYDKVVVAAAAGEWGNKRVVWLWAHASTDSMEVLLPAQAQMDNTGQWRSRTVVPALVKKYDPSMRHLPACSHSLSLSLGISGARTSSGKPTRVKRADPDPVRVDGSILLAYSGPICSLRWMVSLWDHECPLIFAAFSDELFSLQAGTAGFKFL